MTICFVELQAFTDEVLRVAGEETLREFEAELAAKPRLVKQDASPNRLESLRSQAAPSAPSRELSPGGAALRAFYALHQGETGGHPARAARTAEEGSRNH